VGELNGAAPKAYLRGTHREIAPAETLARFRRFAAPMGITRLADVTGLDYIGIPVVMACRPNSRALSVAQGKGLDLDAARTSGFMEAAETWHGEHIDLPVPVASRKSLKRDRRVVDLGIVPQSHDFNATDRTELAWIEAEDLLDRDPMWVPFDLIHTDCRAFLDTPNSGHFPVCSNGLASGNNRLEAICAGLYEIIERDANALWALRPRASRAATRLDLDTVDDPYCRVLIDRLTEAKMMLSVWDMTSDVGVAAFFVRLREGPGNTRMPLGAFCGAGCHLSRGIALSRAVTEAVQSRLTYISGSRDDLKRHDYEEPAHQRVSELANKLWESRIPARRFDEVPDGARGDFDSDLALLLERVKAVGAEHVCVVDLTKKEFGIPVVRLMVPGLELDPEDSPDYALGERAYRFQQSLS
jgi:ribosomal protein S12 methylthiotransferase accessory factor